MATKYTVECVALWGEPEQALAVSLIAGLDGHCTHCVGGIYPTMTLGLLSGCGYTRQPQQLHKQHAVLYHLSWAHLVWVHCALLFQQRGVLRRVQSYVTLCSSVVYGVFQPGHFESTMVPYRRAPKLHFKNVIVPSNYPLDLGWEHGWDCREIHVHKFFEFFTTQLLLLFNTYTCIYGTPYKYIHTYVHTYIHTYVHTYIRAYIHMYIHTYVHTYIHTYIHIRTYIHTYIHTYTHTYIHTYVHTYIRTHIHTYIHTYLRTHIHTYLLFKPAMHHAEHLDTTVQQCEGSNCVSAATKDNVHRVQTICIGPVQLWGLRTHWGEPTEKVIYFGHVASTPMGKKPSKKPQWGKIMRGKNQTKSNTPEATHSSSWANWWISGPLIFQVLLSCTCEKTRHPTNRGLVHMQTGASGLEPHLLCFL